jgi:hypothetical protein
MPPARPRPDSAGPGATSECGGRWPNTREGRRWSHRCPPKGSATAETGRCAHRPNPTPGSGCRPLAAVSRGPPESAQTRPRMPRHAQGQLGDIGGDTHVTRDRRARRSWSVDGYPPASRARRESPNSPDAGSGACATDSSRIRRSSKLISGRVLNQAPGGRSGLLEPRYEAPDIRSATAPPDTNQHGEAGTDHPGSRGVGGYRSSECPAKPFVEEPRTGLGRGAAC